MENQKNWREDAHRDIINVDTREYDYVISKLMKFCKDRGFCFDCKQQLPTILAACEDPFNIMSYFFDEQKWPMIQTNQMHLEDELLDHPNRYKGLFTVTTSYRNEANPVPGRHSKMFPMFEFEVPGHFEDLLEFVKDLLVEFGYSRDNITERNYDTLAQHYGVEELESEHEMKMYKEFGGPVFIKYFPEFTSPFWNMKRCEDGSNNSYKLDVILAGHETLGTAERSCDVDQMRHTFNTISDGKYKEKLYSEFGQDRVETELHDYLAHNFTPRFGGGIGVTRLINALKVDGLMPKFE